MSKTLILVITVQLLLSGCASMKESIITGAGLGAAGGAATGASMFVRNRGKGALTGALTGAVIGAIGSYFIHNGMKKRDDKIRKETLFNLDKFNVSSPQGSTYKGHHQLTMPVVEGKWIETQVKGSKLVEGHRVWIITETPQWIPAKKPKKRRKKR